MNSPYWFLQQIVCWIIFRDENSVSEQVSSDGSGDIGELILKLVGLSKTQDITMPEFEDMTRAIIDAHEIGKVTLSGRCDSGRKVREIPKLDLESYRIFEHPDYGTCLAREPDLDGEFPVWHHVRAKVSEVKDAFPPMRRRKHSQFASTETKCRGWLIELAKAGPKIKKKEEYFEEASQLHNVTRKAFDRVWVEAARHNPEWSKPGRPKKS